MYANTSDNGMLAKTISSLTKTLSESDVVNLVSRLTLIPTINGSKASKLEEGECIVFIYSEQKPLSATLP